MRLVITAPYRRRSKHGTLMAHQRKQVATRPPTSTVNVAYQMVFVRTDYAGTESYSAVMRIVPDPALAFLPTGGVIDIGVTAPLAC
jgi:hypothetical protein